VGRELLSIQLLHLAASFPQALGLVKLIEQAAGFCYLQAKKLRKGRFYRWREKKRGWGNFSL